MMRWKNPKYVMMKVNAENLWQKQNAISSPNHKAAAHVVMALCFQMNKEDCWISPHYFMPLVLLY